MDLYIIRHAEAVALGDNGIRTDTERPLTALGRAQAKALAVALQEHDVQLDKLYTSPLVRARETAAGIVENWNGTAPAVDTCDVLAPGGKAKKLASFLRDADAHAIGLVGHQPDLAEHLAWLIGSKKANINLEKAGIAALRCGEPRKGGAMLLWLVTPEWFGVRVPHEAEESV
jgi:phosphohistidine phosphatase